MSLKSFRILSVKARHSRSSSPLNPPTPTSFSLRFPAQSRTSTWLAGDESREPPLPPYHLTSVRRPERCTAGPRRRGPREREGPLRRSEKTAACAARVHWIMETSCLRKERWRSWERSDGRVRMSLSFCGVSSAWDYGGGGDLQWSLCKRGTSRRRPGGPGSGSASAAG